MKKLTLIVLAIFYSITGFGQHTFVQNIKGMARITFPDTPKIVKAPPDTVYTLNNNGLYYTARIFKIKINTHYRFMKHIADTVYNNLEKVYVKGANGTIIYKNKTLVDGWNGFEFAYKKQTLPGSNQYIYYQSLYLNDSLFVCSVWSNDSLRKDDKNLKAFFTTFKVTLSDDDVRQDNTSDIARNLGMFIGKMIGYGLVVIIIGLLGLGVVFIIRKIVYK